MKRIRLTETDLHHIIKQCVNEALNEIGNSLEGQRALGAVQQRATGRGQFDKENEVRAYAANQRQNASNKRELANANQTGREVYWASHQAPLNKRLPMSTYHQVMKNGWNG